MIELKLSTGEILKYSESDDKVLINDKSTEEWDPVFVPNGNDEPTFFGFHNKKNNKCYDIYGHISKISTEDSIKL